jgi:hypothetical protein
VSFIPPVTVHIVGAWVVPLLPDKLHSLFPNSVEIPALTGRVDPLLGDWRWADAALRQSVGFTFRGLLDYCAVALLL